MEDKIKEVYEIINSEICSKFPFNNRIFRLGLIERLECDLPNTTVKCDEENNPPEVVNAMCAVAKVSWKENGVLLYVKLVFGNPEQTYKFQL